MINDDYVEVVMEVEFVEDEDIWWVVFIFIFDVWVEVIVNGVDVDVVVYVVMFIVFVDLVVVYGEDVVVKLVEGLLDCI